MTQEEEYFLYFLQSIQNLNNSWAILKAIKEEVASPRIVNAAFQFALIEYSKPYKCSRGTLNNKYHLDEKYIPHDHLAQHRRIVNARDQIHAHSDLSVLDAKVHVKSTPYGKIAGQVQNVIHGTEELSNIDHIISLIEDTLDSMYEEVKKLKQELPVN